MTANVSRWRGLVITTIVSLILIELIASQLCDFYSYARWDNFEFYIPLITEAHRQLLSGSFPVWNPYQYLGESFLVNPQAGMFYPFYTICYAVVAALHLYLENLCLLILIVHEIVAAVGLLCLFRYQRVRSSIAYAATLAVISSGFVKTSSGLWVFMSGTFAWLPWITLGTTRVLDGDSSRRSDLMIICGLTAEAFLGQPQMTVYAYLYFGLFAVAYFLVVARRVRALARVAFDGLVAGLCSSVALLPPLIFTASTARKDRFPIYVFLEASLDRDGLRGFLLPIFRALNGFWHDGTSIMCYQGAWLLPALIGAVILWLRAETTAHPSAGHKRLGRVFFVNAAVATLFLLFALGPAGRIYPLTYSVPLWSSFRWPYKFLTFSVAGFGIAGALALQMLAGRERLTRVVAALAAAAGVVAIAWGLRRPEFRATLFMTTAGIGATISGLGSLALLPWLRNVWPRLAFALCAALSAVCITALCQSVNLKPSCDHLGTLTAKTFGIDPRYRVLPMSFTPSLSLEQEHLLLATASASGIPSATGGTTVMVPEWYMNVLHSDTFGILPAEVYDRLLGSHLLRSMNVRYAVVDRSDEAGRTRLRRIPGWSRTRSLDHVDVYENGDTLPRAYVASDIIAYDVDSFRRGLIDNGSPVRSAFVEGVARPTPAGRGEITKAAWRADGASLDAAMDSQGFIVLSVTYYPDWRVTIDGAPTKVYRTNGFLTGIFVPAGSHRIELRYVSRPLRIGVLLAAGGVLAFALSWFVARRRRARS